MSFIFLAAFIRVLTPNLTYSKICGHDLDAIYWNYILWGPSARLCVDLLDPARAVTHTSLVDRAASMFTGNYYQFEELGRVSAWDRLFVVRPKPTSRWTVNVTTGSDHIHGFLSRAYANCSRAHRLDLYLKLSGHQWFGATAGQIYKTYILLWLRHASAQDVITCTPSLTSVGFPPLGIPVCGANLQFFNKEDELGHVDANNLPK